MITISRLARRADWAAQLALWHGEEWAHLYENWDGSVALREFLEEPDAGLPGTLVATCDGRLAGSVSVVYRDLPGSNPGWDPWLASLFVAASERGRGVGGRLIRAAVDMAVAEGVEELYCLTESQQRLFVGCGFEIVEESTMCGHAVTVLRRELRENANGPAGPRVRGTPA